MSLTLKSFLLLLLFLLSVINLSSSSSNAYTSIQTLLQSRGLPRGLFPNNVKSYKLDENGKLEVKLEGPCMAKFETRVYFNSIIKANLSYGGLFGLEGLTQEELFIWFPVKGILVNDPSSGLVLIDIGLAHKQLSRSLFEDPPVCKPHSNDNGAWMKKIGRKVGIAGMR